MTSAHFSRCALRAFIVVATFSSFCGAAAAQGPPEEAPVDTADRQIFANGALDQFEVDVLHGRGFRWEGEVWAGTSENRLWLRSEGQIDDGVVENGRLDILYDRPFSTFFDFQAGLRLDLDDRPGRTWAAFGVEGHAAYVFKGWVTAYVSEGGRAALALRGSYDRLLSDRLILQPELKLNLYAQDDPTRGIGSGLSDLSVDLRLRYEMTEQLAPYVGVTYRRRFGDTAEFARANGEGADDGRVVIGVRSWF